MTTVLLGITDIGINVPVLVAQVINFTFLLIVVTQVLTAIANLKLPLVGVLNLVSFLLYLYLFYYVFRSMRVVYGESRFRTTLKFLSLGMIYFLLLGVTMMAGLVYAMLSLS